MTDGDEAARLRDAAEARLAVASGAGEEAAAGADLLRLVHELQVHKIELEMQNRELRESRAGREVALARYTELYDFAPVGYLTLTCDALIAEINLTGATLLGVVRRDLLQKRFAAFVVREDRERWAGFLASVIARDDKQNVELQLQRGDGTLFHAQLDCIRHRVGADHTVMPDVTKPLEVIIALTDVSARRIAEKQARFHSALLKAVGQAVIVTDAEGRITYLNSAAESLYGWSAFEATGRNVMDVTVPRISRDQAAEIMDQLRLGKAWSGDFMVTNRQGRVFPVEVNDTPVLDDKGKLVSIIGISFDITERKRLDQALTERNLELERARAVAEMANRAKTDFLSSMSHELRTPLNAILGFAQLMESAVPPPTAAQQRDLGRILKAGWYLLELINEILDLALIESGKAMLTQEPVSLVEVMLECRAMVEPQARKRGITMRFPLHDSGWFVNADRTRLKQVLINLMFNAVKYNRPEGTVAVDCRPVSAETLRISIRDSGAGLTAEQMGQLFQPFNRLGREAGAEEGTGIGLVVTRRLVELMDGTIGVDSTVGTGSEFWIELGLASAPVSAPAGAAATPPPVTEDALAGTLLYVEDNPANLELIEQLVARRPQLHLLSAADGKLGIEFALAYQPQVIVMDINLPDISGVEVMKSLRADPATAHIPIIALSANALPGDIAKALQAGFYRYLTKPIKIEEFMDALDMAFRFAATRANGAAGRG